MTAVERPLPLLSWDLLSGVWKPDPQQWSYQVSCFNGSGHADGAEENLLIASSLLEELDTSRKHTLPLALRHVLKMIHLWQMTGFHSIHAALYCFICQSSKNTRIILTEYTPSNTGSNGIGCHRVLIYGTVKQQSDLTSLFRWGLCINSPVTFSATDFVPKHQISDHARDVFSLNFTLVAGAR